MNQKKLETICVYCGSSSGIQPEYVEVAKLLGEVIAIRHLSLVYGGSNIGLMGIVANTVLENGGKVIGVIPNLFAEKITHRELTQIYQVGSMKKNIRCLSCRTDLSPYLAVWERWRRFWKSGHGHNLVFTRSLVAF